jgi:hypothetical protein
VIGSPADGSTALATHVSGQPVPQHESVEMPSEPARHQQEPANEAFQVLPKA